MSRTETKRDQKPHLTMSTIASADRLKEKQNLTTSIERRLNLEETIKHALKKEKRYLNGKKIVFCVDKSNMQVYNNDVAIYITQVINNSAYKVYIANLSSSEYQALTDINIAICSELKARKVEFYGSSYFNGEYAIMDIEF